MKRYRDIAGDGGSNIVGQVEAHVLGQLPGAADLGHHGDVVAAGVAPARW